MESMVREDGVLAGDYGKYGARRRSARKGLWKVWCEKTECSQGTMESMVREDGVLAGDYRTTAVRSR